MSILHEGEVEDARTSTVNTTNQSYPALVWRKFRRSVPGMIGLVLVCLLLLTAIFAEFVAPWRLAEIYHVRFDALPANYVEILALRFDTTL